MSQTYLLEDASGNYITEDGNTLIQDIPTKVDNSTIQITEASNQKKTIIRAIVDTLDLTETKNYFKGLTKTVTQFIVSVEDAFNKKVTNDVFTLEDGTGSYLLEDGSGLYRQDIPVKQFNEIVGFNETHNHIRGLRKTISDTVGLTEIREKIEGFVVVVTQTLVSFEEALAKKISDLNYYTLENGLGSYILESGAGYYAIDNLQIIKNAITDTVGFTDSKNMIHGTVHNIAETVGLTEVFNRLRDIVRTFTEVPGIVETVVRSRDIVRNIQTIVEMLEPTENVNRARIMFRNKADTVGITEAKDRLRAIVRNFSEIVGLTELMQFLEGIVKIPALDTVGLVEVSQRIRFVFISHFIGIFTSTDAVNVNTFTATDSDNIGDMTAVNSHNLGDFIIIDDD